MGTNIRFAILGPVRAWRDDTELDLGPPKQRAMLALLLAYAGRPVTVGEIVDVLWGTEPPTSSLNIVHRQVGLLRRLFEPDLPTRAAGRWLIRAGGGYRLDADPDSVDLLHFRDLVNRARATGDVPLFTSALALWQGPVAAGVETDVRTHPAFAALDREHLATVKEVADLALASGQADQALTMLQRVRADHPFDEALQSRLILALAAAGRQADALEAYQTVRTRLADELGIDPGPELRAAHDRVLRPPAEQGAPAQEAAPVRQPAIRPAQLPADLSTFTGRRSEIAQVLALHTDSPQAPATVVITAIDGMAGIGKTTLAVHWAHQVADRFPDGQLYVNLRGFDPVGTMMSPGEAIRGFLDAFEVSPHRIPASLAAQAALYRSLLAGRRMLVLLDNARDTEQVRPLLPGSPGCLVIVTSRNQLTGLVAGEGAHPLTLDLLSPTDARDFLSRRLGAARVAAEPEAVEKIITACGGLPLALAIVAARAAAHARFPLAAVTAELHDTRRSLDAFTGADPTTDVRAVFSWSYQALTAPAARLFRRLALHPAADISVPAAASLDGIQPSDVRPLLAELTRAHLIDQQTPGRYAFHDLLRAYAAELAHHTDTEEERRSVTRRLLDHYLHTTHTANRLMSPHQQHPALDPAQPDVTPDTIGNADEALAWFTAEHASILAAIDLAARHGFDEHVYRLATAIGDFLNQRGHWRDWAATQCAALDAAVRLGDWSAQAHTHRLLGLAYSQLGHNEDAHHHLTLALNLYQELDDPIGQATTHRGFAALVRSDSSDKALHHAEQALALYRAGDNPGGEGNALNEVGWYSALLGDYHRALDHCEQALVILEKLGNRRGQAATWDSLGYAHHHLGDHHRAIDCYRRAADLRHATGDRHPEAETLNRLAHTYLAVGDRESAHSAWEKALTILTQLDHPDADQVRANLGALSG
ncbi:AfsR/SARP family transcriptional regulator [Micromonospora sp. CB01531]|uniref:AfsR/SARP family transcriptional regulator n=1 Tax=Micromonospora sp. CB01531 TaxID=1718947 RepID=UPI0018E9E85E|nr:BTAD domain-containing putative transcriptional regulator [Micromonospora sp. CB01531]